MKKSRAAAPATKISAEEHAKMAALLLERKSIEQQRLIVEQQLHIFSLEIARKYGRPDEQITVQPDGTLVRQPALQVLAHIPIVKGKKAAR